MGGSDGRRSGGGRTPQSKMGKPHAHSLGGGPGWGPERGSSARQRQGGRRQINTHASHGLFALAAQTEMGPMQETGENKEQEGLSWASRVPCACLVLQLLADTAFPTQSFPWQTTSARGFFSFSFFLKKCESRETSEV